MTKCMIELTSFYCRHKELVMSPQMSRIPESIDIFASLAHLPFITDEEENVLPTNDDIFASLAHLPFITDEENAPPSNGEPDGIFSELASLCWIADEDDECENMLVEDVLSSISHLRPIELEDDEKVPILERNSILRSQFISVIYRTCTPLNISCWGIPGKLAKSTDLLIIILSPLS